MEIVTTTVKIRNELSDLVNRVSYANDSVIIERRGKPMAALISMAEYNYFCESKLKG